MKTQTEEEILNKLTAIETLIKVKENKPLNFTEAAVYLNISQSHLYRLTGKKKIPCYKPAGKYLYFYKEELDMWVKSFLGF